MNKTQMNVVALFIGVMLLNQSCRTKLINVQIVSNPKIALAPEVKKIALINLVKTNNVANKVGEVLAGEIPGNDSRLATECLNSLDMTISSSKKYTVSQSPVKVPQKNNNLSFGEPISWSKIDSIAKAENADVVIALEYFNASFAVNINQTILNNGNKNPTLDGVVPNLIPGMGRVYGESRAETGFRIYDNLHKTIVFQNNASFFQSHSINYFEAVKMVMVKNDHLHDISKYAGQQFAGNFFPVRFYANRTISKYKSDKFKMAYRLAIVGQWQSAADIFEQILNESTSTRAKWRSAYNMALCYEVLGDLPKAYKMAQEAYAISGKGKVLRYANLINGRIQNIWR